jgi:hypothetical protein
MWKMALILILTALAILGARLAYDPPGLHTGICALVSDMRGGASTPLMPLLMYAGVRG